MSEEVRAPIEQTFSSIEQKLIGLVARGKSDTTIAEELSMSSHSVNQQLLEMGSRIGARNRLHLVTVALRNGSC